MGAHKQSEESASRNIRAIAGPDPRRLKPALLVLPGPAVLMIGVNLAILTAMK